MDPIAELQKLLPAELLTFASLFVFGLQVTKQAVPFVDTTKPLPKPLAWTLFAANFAVGIGLSLAHPDGPGSPWTSAWYIQGPLLGVYCHFLFKTATWAFGQPTSTGGS